MRKLEENPILEEGNRIRITQENPMLKRGKKIMKLVKGVYFIKKIIEWTQSMDEMDFDVPF